MLYPFLFFFNDTATTEIYTLSLHDALPISVGGRIAGTIIPRSRNAWLALTASALPPIIKGWIGVSEGDNRAREPRRDRKSTRLNSSHSQISYAVFCLKKKKTRNNHIEIFII